MKKFTVAAFMLLICTAALLSTTEGQRRIDRRCQCIQTHSNPPIAIEKILSLKVIPPGPQCKTEEIIATMKRGLICLNPNTDWVISLKKAIKRRSDRMKYQILPQTADLLKRYPFCLVCKTCQQKVLSCTPRPN